MRKTLLSTLALTVLLGASGVGLAQESLKPVVVVSFAGYDELKADIAFIGKLRGNPGLDRVFEKWLTEKTGGQWLTGVDRTRPWGLLVQLGGQWGLTTVGFIPITDVQKFVRGHFRLLGAIAGDPPPKRIAPPERGADGVYSIDAGGQVVFLVAKGDWALVSNTREGLDRAPADPTALFGGLEKQYDVAVSFSVKNIPDALQQMMVGLLQMGAQASLQQETGESDEQFALRRNRTMQWIQQTVQMIKELDTVLMGFTVDRTARTSLLDFTVTPVPGTQTAENLAHAGDVTTDFAGFSLPDAAVVMQITRKMSDTDVAQMKISLASARASLMKELSNQGLGRAKEQKARELLERFLDVLDKTLDSKRMDFGAVVRLGANAATTVVGGYVADSGKLQKLIKDIVDVAKQEEPNIAPFVQFDAEQHSGVTLHVIPVPLPRDDPNAPKIARLVGDRDRVEIVLGTGADSFFVALGPDAAKTLKEVIDKSKAEPGKKVPLLQTSVAFGPIAKLVADAAEDEPHLQETASKIAGLLEETDGRDHVNITAKVVENGQTVRIELGECIPEALGVIFTYWKQKRQEALEEQLERIKTLPAERQIPELKDFIAQNPGTQQADEARKMLAKAEEDAPRENRAARDVDIAEKLKKQGRIEPALKRLKEVIKKYPKTRARERADRLLKAMEREREALEELE